MTFRQFAVILVPLVSAGCGGGESGFQQVKGKVDFDGRPVVYGTVEFLPDSAKGHKGPGASADIVDGVYNTSQAGGQGLSKGPHIARVTMFAEKVPQTADETVVTKAPPPIAVGYPLEVSVEGPDLDLNIPAKAKGFDMYKSGRPTGPRPGDP
jgi:hypothetical protein